MAGFIKLSRDIIDWGWYSDPNTRSVFLHLLLTANYEDRDYLGHNLRRGDAVIGRKALAEKLGISEQNIRTALNHLKSTSEITIKTTSKFSIITICNFERWQKTDLIPNQQTNQQSNQQLTSDQPAANQQLTTPKEIRIEEYNNNIESKLSLAESELRRERDSLKEQLEASNSMVGELQARIAELETTIRNKETPKGRIQYAQEFDEDFKLYHRKGNKKKAYERWRKLSEEDKERMRRHIPVYWQSNEPQYLKDFEGYINQRVFDSVIYDKRSGRILYDPDKVDASTGYNPTGTYVIPRDDGTFLYFGGYDGYVEKEILDGYENSTRPDGATIVLNNGRGTAKWNKSETKWEVTA